MKKLLAVSIMLLSVNSLRANTNDISTISPTLISTWTFSNNIVGSTATFSGKVGIGTINPTTALHIIRTNVGTETIPLIITNPGGLTNGTSVSIGLGVYNTTALTTKIQSVSVNAAAGNYRTDFYNYDPAGLTNEMSLYNGNVGIGTISPLANLHISSTSASASQYMLAITTSPTANAYSFIANGAGSVWISSTCSALTIIDRTPYPPDKETAYRSILSMQKKEGSNELDDEKLDDYVKNTETKIYITYNELTKSNDTVTKIEYGRNLSATVSSLVEIIKDLQKRIEKLEQK